MENILTCNHYKKYKIIKPIYKNKGDQMDPKNYKPITILSCLGKLFTAVLSERLTKYSDDFLFVGPPKSDKCQQDLDKVKPSK
jgi:site-specific DNA-cytosine methylase